MDKVVFLLGAIVLFLAVGGIVELLACQMGKYRKLFCALCFVVSIILQSYVKEGNTVISGLFWGAIISFLRSV